METCWRSQAEHSSCQLQCWSHCSNTKSWCCMSIQLLQAIKEREGWTTCAMSRDFRSGCHLTCSSCRLRCSTARFIAKIQWEKNSQARRWAIESKDRCWTGLLQILQRHSKQPVLLFLDPGSRHRHWWWNCLHSPKWKEAYWHFGQLIAEWSLKRNH